MFRSIVVVAFATVILAAPASANTRPVPIAVPFTKIVAGGSDRVVVRQGAERRVTMTGDARDLDRMAFDTRGDTLSIMRRGKGDDRSKGVTVTITLPRLDKVTLRGSGSVALLGLDQPALGADLSGSGSLWLDDARIGSLALALKGSGSLAATGEANSVALSLAGSGDAKLDGLDARDIVVSQSGSGSVVAHATGTATINAGGSGSVSVKGTDRCIVDSHGSGSVRCAR